MEVFHNILLYKMKEFQVYVAKKTSSEQLKSLIRQIDVLRSKGLMTTVQILLEKVLPV